MITLLCAAGATIALIVRLLLLIDLHRTGARHPVREAVSDYGVGATRPRFQLMMAAATLGWWLVAGMTWTAYPAWPQRGKVTIALAVVGLTTALMRYFPTVLPGHRMTWTGRTHYALAITQFALSYTFMGDISRLLGGPAPTILQHIALVGLVGLCLLLVPALQRKVPAFGLFERIFLVSVAVFYLYFAASCAIHVA